MSADIITFANLLQEQDIRHDTVKKSFLLVIESVMEPVLDILKKDYLLNMGSELSIDLIEQLKMKYRESYYGNSVIEIEDSKYNNLPYRFMDNYFSICVYPHHLMKDIYTQEQHDELRKNPEFIKHYIYYQDMENRNKIKANLQDILLPCHAIYQPIYQDYLNFMKRGEEMVSKMDDVQMMKTLSDARI
jgi:hypothetical protein